MNSIQVKLTVCPSELGFDWAQQPSDIPLKGYTAFGRPYCEKEEQK